MKQLQVGDRIAYSVQFLGSIAMSHSPMAHARGIIVALTDETKAWRLATIKWEKQADMPERVNVKNLARVGPTRQFCNVD